MKMKTARQAHYDSGPNMTPLVDVVMVILIFLMLAGSFAGSSRFIKSKSTIHQFGGSVRPDPNKPIEEDLDVYIDPKAESAAFGGGFAVSFNPQMAPITDPKEFTRVLVQKKAAFELINPRKDPRSPTQQIVLHPAANLRWQDLISAYVAATQSKIEKVQFAPSRPAKSRV